MHDFTYARSELKCEKIKISKIIDKVKTPFYLYSHHTMVDHFMKIKRAFRFVNPLICYSVKANSNLAVLKSLIKKGAGLDVVSGGELFRAKKAGCNSKKIVYAGVGKTDDEIRDAVKAGILLFNVESLPELQNIDRIAGEEKKTVKVSLRVNPGVKGKTDAYLTTGTLENKFGLTMNQAKEVFIKKTDYHNLDICGVHVHIGSQIVSGDPFIKAFRKILIFLTSLEKEGIRIEYLNLGGGLGIVYGDETPQTADEFAKKIKPLIKKKKYKIILEPGRFIVGNAGIFVTRVTYVKKIGRKRFVVVDGGMNDLIRPSLYKAYHETLPVIKKQTETKFSSDIVGPICESGDFFVKDRQLPKFEPGDCIAIMSAGAYGFTMSSNYNSRPRVPEVLVKGNSFSIVKKRESYEDLIKGETIPSMVK